jgi:hypothetical protein
VIHAKVTGKTGEEQIFYIFKKWTDVGYEQKIEALS